MNLKENGVFFETENLTDPLIRCQKRASGMPQFVIQLSGGIVTNEKQANYVLIGFVLVAIIFSYLSIFDPYRKSPEIVQYRDKISPEVRAKLPPGVWQTIPAKFR